MKILKLKFVTFGLLAMIGASVFFTSCEQKALISQTNEYIIDADKQEVLKQRATLAQHLSVVINEQHSINESLKTLCLAEQAKGFYETEFFFNLEKDITQSLLQGKTLDQVLTVNRDEMIRHSLDFLYSNDPGLSILMLGDINTNEYSNRIYFDNGFDDSDPNAQIQYYENGVLGSHSIGEKPTSMTFVVRESEAYLTKEELLLENPSDVTQIGDILGKKINVFGYNTNPTVGQDSGMSELPTHFGSEELNQIDSRFCQRDMVGGKERLYAFRTSDSNDGWRGRGEFIFDIIFGDSGNPMNTIRHRHTGVKADRWYYPEKRIITWTPSDTNRMKYVVHEEDPGQARSVEFSIPGTSIVVNLDITNGDDFVGEAIVEYCDEILNFEYYPHYAGDVTFVCAQY